MRRRRGIMGLNGGAGIPVITATATGNPLTFETDLVRPLKSLVIPFTPIQEGTGDPSPDNVRPISGWTGCEITQTPEDLIELTSRSITNANVTINIGSSSIFVTGMSQGNLIYKLCAGNTKTYPAGTYTIYCDNPDIYVNTTAYESDFRSNVAVKTAVEAFILDNVRMMIRKNITYDGTPFHVYLFEGSNVIPTTLPIAFTDPTTGDPMTVYGGTLTLNEDGSADLSVSWGSKDLGSIGWLQSPTPNCFYYSGSAVPYRKTGRIMCSCFKNDGGQSSSPWYGADGTFRYYDGASNLREIYVHDERYSSASAFKDGVTGEMFVYEIGSPQTYHFDNIGQLITSFVGTNNIWTDTNGTNTATYLKHQS